jgi:uncharacterized protein (TIGR00251 family)
MPNVERPIQKRRNEEFCTLVTPHRIMKTIQIKVKPNARISALEEVGGGTWLAQLKSPPIDGKANKELVELIARHFACPKSAVAIKSGASGRMKLVTIRE